MSQASINNLHSHLAAHGDQLKRSLDPRILRRHRQGSLDAIARRAERLCNQWGGDAALEEETELTLLSGAAHLSLVADLMPIGNAMTIAYRKASVDIPRALLGQAYIEEAGQSGLSEFANSITEPVLTSAMKQVIDDWSPSGPLHKIRRHLGITLDSERPFELVVIDADHPGDGFEPSAQSQANEKRLARHFGNGTPAAWVSHSGEENTMYLRRGTVEELLGSIATDSLAFNEADTGLLAHEYVHTQRSLRLSGQPGFGFDFNEILASDAPAGLTSAKPHNRGVSYLDTAQLLDFVSLMTEENLHLAVQTFGVAGDIDGFYRSLAVSCGMSAMALMACNQPTNYGASRVPKSHTKKSERTIIDTVLNHRQRTRGRHTVEATIQRNMGDLFRTYRGLPDNDFLDQGLDYRLPEVFQRSFERAKEVETAVLMATEVGSIRVLRSSAAPLIFRMS